MKSLSVGEKKYVVDGVAADIRADGRSRKDFRPISLQTSTQPAYFDHSRDVMKQLLILNNFFSCFPPSFWFGFNAVNSLMIL